MRNFILKIPGKIFFYLVVIFLLYFQGEGLKSSPVDGGENKLQEVKKARLYKDIYPLISESDLYCSFFVLENKKELDTEIVGVEREKEKMLLGEHDVFYINKGEEDGIETGHVFLILEIGPKIKKFGHLALMRGRAKIVDTKTSRASAILEKACGQVMVGHFLVPFEEKGGLLGKDLGYDVPLPEGEGLKGMIIYSQREYQLSGSGDWVIIDLGEEDGIQFGQQLIVYRRLKKKDSPLKTVGNLIVIDTQRKTSTVKILSLNDALRVGDLVQTHFK